MSLTILETLENASHNLKQTNLISKGIGISQLDTAIELLLKGYGIHTAVEPLVAKHGSIANVPDTEGD